DWSSDVCSSDLEGVEVAREGVVRAARQELVQLGAVAREQGAGARAVGRADGAGRPEILDGEERLQALALGERLGAALGAEERPVSGTVHLSPPVPHVPVVPIALAWTVRRLLGGHAGGAAGPVGPLGVEAREHVRQNF